MDNSVALLARQSGLLKTTQIIANNIANASTAGFKAEGTIFSEYVAAAGADNPSLSMGHLVAHSTDFSAGSMKKTDGVFDLAINGQGFFKVNTPQGPMLTKAGAFRLDAEGLLVDAIGNNVVDEGGSAVQIPPDAVTVAVAIDGTISVDGELFGNIGVFEPQGDMDRVGNNYWVSLDGDQPVEFPSVLQGFLEQSNVSPVAEMANLIMAQRLFDAGQTVTEQEHERLTSLINAIRQQG